MVSLCNDVMVCRGALMWYHFAMMSWCAEVCNDVMMYRGVLMSWCAEVC